MNLRQSVLPEAGPAAIWIWLPATVYFFLNALTLGLVSSTADLDQAQQLVLSQDLSLGYGAQPPLYTWLVNLLFSITGPNRSVLLALKAALLSAFALGFLKIARELEFDPRQQALTVIGIALLPAIVWESQRDLTHSVLATVLSTWTLWSVFRVHRNASWRNYIVFGLLVGLGLLSKYNYGVFVLALLAAALVTPGFRERLLSSRMLVSLAIIVLVFLPHLLWIISHTDQTLASSHKFKIQDGASSQGIVAAVLAPLAFLGPLLLAYGLSWRRGARAHAITGPGSTLLSRLLLILLALLLGLVVVSGASNIKSRWLQPLLFFVPILCVTWGIAKPRIFIAIGLAMMLATALLLPGRTLTASLTGVASRPNLPYMQIGEQLRDTTGIPDVVISPQELLAGNMRLVFPDTRIEVVRSKTELRDRLKHHDKETLLFMTDNGGRGSIDEPWNQYKEVFRDSAPAKLDWPLLHAPTMTHRVHWLKFDGK
jgi:4-amino-4-deoxy-L-arabinose transferase-like glycosyltransferase